VDDLGFSRGGGHILEDERRRAGIFTATMCSPKFGPVFAVLRAKAL
jgi:hypothetical protein